MLPRRFVQPQEDLKWLTVEGTSLFLDSYVTGQYGSLPAFDGTEDGKGGDKKADKAAAQASESLGYGLCRSLCDKAFLPLL
jgi:hypothetical protein